MMPMLVHGTCTMQQITVVLARGRGWGAWHTVVSSGASLETVSYDVTVG